MTLFLQVPSGWGTTLWNREKTANFTKHVDQLDFWQIINSIIIKELPYQYSKGGTNLGFWGNLHLLSLACKTLNEQHVYSIKHRFIRRPIKTKYKMTKLSRLCMYMCRSLFFLTQALSPALIYWSYTLQICNLLNSCSASKSISKLDLACQLFYWTLCFVFLETEANSQGLQANPLSVSLADCETRNDTNWSLIILSVVFISLSLVKIMLFSIPSSRCHEAPPQLSASTAKQWLLWPPKHASLARQCSQGSKGWQKSSKILRPKKRDGWKTKKKTKPPHMWWMRQLFWYVFNICDCFSQSYGWLYDN